MSRNKKRKERSGGGVARESAKPQAGSVTPLRPSSSPPAESGGASAQFADVRRAIERQSYKSALEKAKELHKKLGSEESKALLIEAYIARIEGMQAKNLTAEAKALADLVVSRFPETAGRLAGLQRGLAAQTGDVATLAGPLADSNAPAEVRAQAEQAVRRELVDLQTLADSSTLPEGHPLRVAAADLARAFTAVTSGAVDDAGIELASVSHRSPLAPWKTLIRAIASLYRGQDEQCRRFLAALDEDSAPARVAGVLRTILTESWDESLTPAGRRLVEKIMGPRIELRLALRALDEAFTRDDERGVYRQTRRAVDLCGRVCPARLERLKQHISVRAAVANYPVEPMVSAMGGPSKHDAYFFRLFARVIEGSHGSLEACELWDRFRRAAIQEGLFSANGPENAFLYLHMADLLRRIPADELWEAQQDFLDQIDEWGELDEEGWDTFGTTGRYPRVKRDLYFMAPELLYERAAALRPDPDIYRQWLDFVEAAERGDLQPDSVAEKWVAAFPEDPRPLLHLAESAEDRGAFDKALKYIGRAEQLGGIDPKVRRARFRLWVAKAVRHLKQRKPHLAAKDFAQLEQLPQAAEKDRPAFLLSLKWIDAAVRGAQDEATRLHDQVRDLLGSQVAAVILLVSTATECEFKSAATDELVKWLAAYKQKDLIGGLVRAYEIGTDVDVTPLMPMKWGPLLTKWFKRSDCDLDSAGLLIITQAALAANWPEVAYYCSGHGLRKGGPMQARFLFLRGKSLPYAEEERRQDCYAAALELAKRVRDMDLVAEIADASRRAFNPFALDMPDVGDLAIDEENLKEITDFERRTQKYPKSRSPYFGGGSDFCQCPACRRARGEIPTRKSKSKGRRGRDEPYLFDDLYGDEFENEDLDEDFEAQLPDRAQDVFSGAAGMPPELAEIMAELVRATGGRIPRSKKELDRIIGRDPALRRRIEDILLESMARDGTDPFADDEEWPDHEDDLPDRPFPPPSGRRGGRKKKRRR